MITFYLLLLIPIAWAILVKFVLHSTITWIEAFSMIVVVSLLIVLVYWAGMYSEMRDTQILNGQVTSKEKVRVSCRHSYSCRCRTVRTGKTSTTVCDTCYDHSFDNDWNVNTTIGRWTINTIDRQGLNEPPRWTQVKQFDPVSESSSYINYVKAVPESLFNFNPVLASKFKDGFPGYPMTIYDYYKINRFVQYGVSVPDAEQWNNDISTLLGYIGPLKEVNLVVVLTKQSDPMYAKGLQAKWIGGKKNDIVIVIGAPEYPKIGWVDVFSWSKSSIVNVTMRDAILEVGEVDRVKIMSAVSSTIPAYVRKPMSEFEYLKEQIEPPQWVLWLVLVLSLSSLGGLTYLFHREDMLEMFGS